MLTLLQVCVTATSLGDTPATLTFALRGGGAADTANITITNGVPKVTTVGTATLTGATLDTATIANMNDFRLCLIIAGDKIPDLAASTIYTLTVGGTASGGAALVAGTARLTVSNVWIR